LCNRLTNAKLWRSTLRATGFQPESIMKMRKRGGPDGLGLRGRTGTGSSITVASLVVDKSRETDPGAGGSRTLIGGGVTASLVLSAGRVKASAASDT
jgi:hypothetical protein